MTFPEFNRRFPTERAAIDHFIQVRYGDSLTCPHCGAKTKVYRYRERARACHCKACNRSFSPFTGTIFEKSTTGLVKWFYAIHLFLNDRKGVSACNLQRELGVTYKTAWRILQQIRAAMGNAEAVRAFTAVVEVDETYVGGRPRRRNLRLDADGNPVPSDEPPAKRGRGTKKTPVVGVRERSSKKVFARVALPNEAGQKLTGKQLLSVIEEATADGTLVVTDDLNSYNILDRECRDRFVHLTVNHSLGQYSDGKGGHTNNIENWWSLIKRGWVGTYHHWSVKYMPRYLDEFAYRTNERENPDAFDEVLKRAVVPEANYAWMMKDE